MFEHLKTWVHGHKALAIGGGLALMVLLYLWLRSGSAQPAASDGGINAYYAAQAAAAGDAASSANSTNALAASTNQTNAAETVALAQVTAAAIPYQAQLQALTLQANLTAYQDYLAEQAIAGHASTSVDNSNPNTPGSNVWGVANSDAGTPIYFQDITGVQGAGTILNPSTGQRTSIGAQTPGTWASLPSNAVTTFVNWDGTVGHAPTPWTPAATPVATVLQFGDFKGATTPQLGGGWVATDTGLHP